MNAILTTLSNFPEQEIRQLLNLYHIEEYYLKTIKAEINLESFIEFKINHIKNLLLSGNKIWHVLNESMEPIGIFGIQRNEDRSKNFGLNYYEYYPVFNFSHEAIMSLSTFEDQVLSNETKNLHIDYLKVKLNASD